MSISEKERDAVISCSGGSDCNATFDYDLSFCEAVLLLLSAHYPAAIFPTVGFSWIFNVKPAGANNVFVNGEPLVSLLDLRLLLEPPDGGPVAVEGALEDQLLRHGPRVALGEEHCEMIVWGRLYKVKQTNQLSYQNVQVFDNPQSSVNKVYHLKFIFEVLPFAAKNPYPWLTMWTLDI